MLLLPLQAPGVALCGRIFGKDGCYFLLLSIWFQANASDDNDCPNKNPLFYSNRTKILDETK